MLRWSEVLHEIHRIETSPIENCLSMLQEKNLELELIWRKLEHDPQSINIAVLGQNLNGVILAAYELLLNFARKVYTIL